MNQETGTMKVTHYYSIVVVAVLFFCSICEAGTRQKSRTVKRKKTQRQAASRVNTRRERKIDTDKNGRVSPKERKAAADSYLATKSQVDKKWEKKADKNQDGSVDAKELKNWSKKHDGYMSPAERQAYLKKRAEVNTKVEEKIDTNNNGTVERSELNAALKARHEALKKKFDADGDGKLNKKEYNK